MKSIGLIALAVSAMACTALAALQDPRPPGQDLLAEATKLLAEEQWQEAYDKFDLYLEDHSNSFEARAGAARAALNLAEWDLANFHALKAEKLKPNDVDIIALTGLTFQRMGQVKMANGGDPTASFEEAIRSFTKAAKFQPDNAVHFGHLGYLNFNLSRFVASAEAHLMGAKAAPEDSAYPYWAAQSYLWARDFDKGIAAIDRSIKLAPSFGPYQFEKGNLHLQRGADGDADKAGEAFAAALIGEGLPQNDMHLAAQRLRQSYADEKRWAPLLKHSKAWAKAAPKNAFSHWYLGYAQYLAGEYAEARKSYLKSEKVWGKDWTEIRLRVGQCHESAGELDKAVEEYVAAANDKNYSWSSEAEAPIFRIRSIYGTLFANGEFERAADIAEKKCLPVVDDGQKYLVYQDAGFFVRDWALALPRGAKRKKLFKRSTALYEKAVAHFPGAVGATDAAFAQIQNDTGLMYHYYLNDMKKAVDHYKKALAYDASYGDAILNLGRVYNSQKKFAEAKALLETGPRDRADIQQALAAARRGLGKE